jgi:hypothetical protein
VYLVLLLLLLSSSDCPLSNCLMVLMCPTHQQYTWCCCRAS